MVRSGEADLHAGMFYSAQRDQLYEFTRPTIGIEYYFYLHKNILGVKTEADLEGLVIGVPKGFTHKLRQESTSKGSHWWSSTALRHSTKRPLRAG